MVMVVYLISYYRDEGSTGTELCQLPWISPECAGHNGDSEAIALEVYYSSATAHWILHGAKYSQHSGYGDYYRYPSASSYPTSLYYPARLGGYPRAYVAQGKHANY
jgi:hypothetical protein